MNAQRTLPDPVAGAQRIFRAVLDALSRPTRPVAIDGASVIADAPAALGPAVASIAFACCDDSTPVWLDAVLACDEEVRAWIAFRTGAPLTTEPAAAAFAFAAAAETLPALDAFAPGSDEAPHTSTTIVLATGTASGDASGITSAGVVLADGPGFPEPREWTPPAALPQDFVEQWAANHARFPRGVDLLLVDDDGVTGLPRTTSLRLAPLAPGSGSGEVR
ncbi:MAG: phosphonate C-P lyase system protein PhnH [Microbacteriaceae bacterium]|nr:phosphonate C-P lyase system protein PhnH [Microbacteriaceae bacterium]